MLGHTATILRATMPLAMSLTPVRKAAQFTTKRVIFRKREGTFWLGFRLLFNTILGLWAEQLECRQNIKFVPSALNSQLV